MTDNILARNRAEIDQIDQQILQLLNQRAACAQQIGQLKQVTDPEAPLYRPEREAQVLRQLSGQNPGPLSSDTVVRLFREVISACLALEQPLTVAFLGPAGTYTEAAARQHFGHAVTLRPYAQVADIFRAVEGKEVDYGVVPVENSTEGAVSQTLDCLIQTSLSICAEVTLRIQHQLLSQAQSSDQVRVVYAHQQALAQCRHWLSEHLPQAECVAVDSNGLAAQTAAQQPHTAAIAGSEAASHYQLQTLAHAIADTADNSTRFVVLGTQHPEPSGQDKTSLILSTQNQPGGLHQLLAPLAEHRISMSRIESRPSRQGRWDYLFFVDLLGHQHDEDVSAALARLSQQACFYQFLGSYPYAKI
ncbi:MAG: prephenate dehydratase [Pseudomonadota bacterium]